MRKVDNFLYEKESFLIRGCCFNVYNALSGGIKEQIIDKALFKELTDAGLKIERQKRIDIYYKGEKIGLYIPDFVINESIIIEIKSKPFVTGEDEKQFWGYLKGSEYRLGFLVNFGHQKLDIKRFVYTQHKSA